MLKEKATAEERAAKQMKTFNEKLSQSSRDWAELTPDQHFATYQMVATQYDKQMFYPNGERELFPPPTRNFVSVLECAVNLHDSKQPEPAVKGKLKVEVLFDSETRKEKITEFKETVEKSVGKAVKSLETNVRVCRREGHPVGIVSSLIEDGKKQEDQDFGFPLKFDDEKNDAPKSKVVTLLYFWDEASPPTENEFKRLDNLVKSGNVSLNPLTICRIRLMRSRKCLRSTRRQAKAYGSRTQPSTRISSATS